jgi:glycosyltransferase involved in cell wall biosynthesis
VAAASEVDAHPPLISVIIPTHNRADLLADAIESVLPSPLIVSPEQITVVDDDSHDNTEEVVRRFGVRYMRIAVHSPGASRNAGLALVETPYVAFLDDDDAWLPGNMDAQLAALEAHPNAAFAYGMAQCATEDLEPIAGTFPSPPLPSGFDPDGLHLSYPQLGVVLFRRRAVVEVGGSDPRLPYHEDADLMIRIAARHEMVGVESVGMLYRLRPPSKARSDFFWADARREVTRWRPKHVDIRRRTVRKFWHHKRGEFCWYFIEDAASCLALGHRRDALICLRRAVWVSPAHALRHSRTLGSTFWRCVSGR